VYKDAFSIDYYYARCDIQTAALLACVLIRSMDARDEGDGGDVRVVVNSTQ
jgi:hypothetical protein